MNTLVRKIVVSACCLALMGCADDGVGTTFPVAGKITLNGQLFTSGTATLVLKPDAARANTTRFEPVGKLDDQGGYTVVTKGKSGAPPGWYKVVVAAYEGTPKHPQKVHDRRAVVRSVLPAKYGSAATTDLAIQVVENPGSGAYDLKLTSE
jgi:hypothetical protein